MARSARWGLAVSAAAALLWVGLFTGSARAATPIIQAVDAVAQNNVVSICVTASGSTGIDHVLISWGDGDNYNDLTSHPPGQVKSCGTHAYDYYGIYTAQVWVYSGIDFAATLRTLNVRPSPPPSTSQGSPPFNLQTAIHKCKKKFRKGRKRKRCIKSAKARARV